MNYPTVSASLTRALSLRLPPIAVSLTDEVPAGVPAHEGRVAAGCMFWERATRGTFATSAPDHELCAIGVHTHALAEPSPSLAGELQRTLAVMADLDYVRPDEVAGIPALRTPVRHVVYGPLADSPRDPDVVLLFADGRQGLIVAEAAARIDGGVAPALGRPACAIVAQAVNTGRAALSMGCCGARAYVDTLSDDVALWALPGARLEAYADAIAGLADANRVLGSFHQLRRRDVDAGGAPTIDESLARLQGGADV